MRARYVLDKGEDSVAYLHLTGVSSEFSTTACERMHRNLVGGYEYVLRFEMTFLKKKNASQFCVTRAIF